MKFSLKNLRWYDAQTRTFRRGGLAQCDGKITEVGQLSPESEEMAMDCGGNLLLPGFVDVHTHGRCGADFCSATKDELMRLRLDYARTGSTTVIPTLASDTMEGWIGATARIRDAGYDGIHYEGRYLSPAKRGAHKIELLALPSVEELNALLAIRGDMHVHMTLAPELSGGEDFIRAAVSAGVTVGIGHTDATYEQALRALAAGARSFTHTFNAQPPLHHRAPGAAGAALTTQAYAECICDGIHLHPAVVQCMAKMKMPDRFVLVTDSMMAAGLGDGTYTLAGQMVRVEEGIARTEDGALAGSTLNLLDALRNLMRFAGMSLEEALPCVTVNPAKMIGLDRQVGSLMPGMRADLLLVDPGLYGSEGEILAIWQQGKPVELNGKR